MSDNVGATKRKANLKMKMMLKKKKQEDHNRVRLLCPVDSESSRQVYPSAAAALVQQQQAVDQVPEISLLELGQQKQEQDAVVGLPEQAVVSPPDQEDNELEEYFDPARLQQNLRLLQQEAARQRAQFLTVPPRVNPHSRTPKDGHRFVMHVAICDQCCARHPNAYDDAMLAATTE